MKYSHPPAFKTLDGSYEDAKDGGVRYLIEDCEYFFLPDDDYNWFDRGQVFWENIKIGDVEDLAEAQEFMIEHFNALGE